MQTLHLEWAEEEELGAIAYPSMEVGTKQTVSVHLGTMSTSHIEQLVSFLFPLLASSLCPSYFPPTSLPLLLAAATGLTALI